MESEIKENLSQPKYDISLRYSKDIMLALKRKMRDHNSLNLRKVSFSQIKDLFIDGATRETGNSVIESGLARINMFLRILSKDNFISEFNKNQDEFEPAADDFLKAKEEIEASNLNFDIKDIGELYFISSKESPFIEVYL